MVNNNCRVELWKKDKEKERSHYKDKKKRRDHHADYEWHPFLCIEELREDPVSSEVGGGHKDWQHACMLHQNTERIIKRGTKSRWQRPCNLKNKYDNPEQYMLQVPWHSSRNQTLKLQKFFSGLFLATSISTKVGSLSANSGFYMANNSVIGLPFLSSFK